ncbi:MAG: hypothetical protein V3V03_03485 [Hyphomonadaceae bacterium]
MFEIDSMNPLVKMWNQIIFDAKYMMTDLNVWLQRLSESEKLLGLCIFILVLLYFVIRRPSDQKESGAMGRQFAMALVVVVFFSFGIGWLVDDGAGSALSQLG